MACTDFICIMVWGNQMSQYSFPKMFSEVPEAKEASRWGFLCDYAVLSNGCVVEIGIFHCASNTTQMF